MSASANNMAFSFDDDSRVRMVAMSPASDTIVDYSMNIILMKKSLLQRLVNDAVSMNHESFERDIIQSNVEKLRIYGFEAKGFSLTVDSMQSYLTRICSFSTPTTASSCLTGNAPYTQRFAMICRLFTVSAQALKFARRKRLYNRR